MLYPLSYEGGLDSLGGWCPRRQRHRWLAGVLPPQRFSILTIVPVRPTT